MERNCLCTRFDNFTSAVRHPWQDQAAPWPEPENRGAPPRPLLHLHTLWPPQPARDAAEGGKLLLFLPPGDFRTQIPQIANPNVLPPGDVQVEAQAGPGHRLL